MAVSVNWGFLFVGVLVLSAPLFGVYIRAPMSFGHSHIADDVNPHDLMYQQRSNHGSIPYIYIYICSTEGHAGIQQSKPCMEARMRLMLRHFWNLSLKRAGLQNDASESFLGAVPQGPRHRTVN